MKKISIISAISAVVLLSAFFGLKQYYKPVPVNVNPDGITMCNTDGDTIHVTFDVHYQRHLFAKTELLGSIYVDGIEYQTSYSRNYEGPDLTKGKDSYITLSLPIFHKAGTPSDTLFILAWRPDINLIYFAFHSKSNGGIFFGPADNAEAAQTLSNIYYTIRMWE